MAQPKTQSDPPPLAQLPLLGGAIVKRPITDAIADKIATLIASGILQVGDALPSERELSVTLGVSRDAVRGGIRTLAAQGILEISQGARTRVVRADVGSVKVGVSTARAIDAYDLDAVHGARLLVEGQVVRDAAERIDARGIAVLESLLAAQKSALDDPVRFLISDREFHVAIYRASSNRLLADLGTDLYAYMMEYRREAVARPGAIATSYADHVAIVDALRARDPHAAVAAFAAHTGRIYATTHLLMTGDEAPED